MSQSTIEAPHAPAEMRDGPEAFVDRVETTRRDWRRFQVLRASVRVMLLCLILAGLAAWGDYLWLFSLGFRQAFWIALGAAVVILALRRLIFRTRENLSREETALEIETAFPDLGQRICTTVEYADPTPATMPAWPSLVRALMTETQQKTYRLDFQQVVPWWRLRWPAAAASSVATLFLFLLLVVPAARTAAMRMLLIPAQYTQLEVKPGDCSVKVGSDVTIQTTISGRPVEEAKLLYRKAAGKEKDGEWIAIAIAPHPNPLPEGEGTELAGTLETTLKDCRENLDYRVIAGPVESETFRLNIFHPLVLKKIEATIVPPAYTRQQVRTVEKGDFSAIEGSNIRFRFTLDRAASNAWLRLTPGKGAKADSPLYAGHQPGQSPPVIPLKIEKNCLSGTLQGVAQNLEYEIQAEAADGMKLDPRRFQIRVQPDREPTIRFVKPEAVIEVTPTTEVTIRTEAKDDFGVTQTGIVYQIGEGPKETLKFDEDPQQPVSLSSLAMLYLEDHEVNYQDGMIYYAYAEDNSPAKHRVTSEMQFIDIRPYKREFEAAKAKKGKEKIKSVTLELLISRQRTYLQRTFGQSKLPAADARVARRLTRAERALADMTADFAEKIAERFGPIPSLEHAVEAMRSAVGELEQKAMQPACRQEEIALADLIQARMNLRQLLMNPKSGPAAEQLDYQARKNAPEIPKDEEEDEEDDLQNQLEELAKTEQETAEDIEAMSDGKSFGNPSQGNPENESKADEQAKNDRQPQQGDGQNQGDQQPQQGEGQNQNDQQPQQGDGQNQGDQQPQQGEGQGQGGKQSPKGKESLAKRQEQAAQQAAGLEQQMQQDEAMTDLAVQRMAEARRTISASAQMLKSGHPRDAGRQAREAAAQLQQLLRQVAGLKAAELSGKLSAAEKIAREMAQAQRDAAEGKNPGESQQSQQNQQGEQRQQGQKGEQGQEGQKGEQGQQGEEGRQGEQGRNGDEGPGSDGPGGAADRLDAQAEEARTLEDLLKEARIDAREFDAEIADALLEAMQSNPPEEIAEEIRKAAGELKEGRRDQAWHVIRKTAERLDQLAEQLHVVRQSYLQPTLESLMETEKQAAELQKVLLQPVADRDKSEVEKNMTDLHQAVMKLLETDPKLGKDAASALAAALEGGGDGGGGYGGWREHGRGFYDPPVHYVSAVGRVVRALQVRIQEIILKDAVLDQDQPVPPQYKEQVERYYKILSEDLR